MSINVTCTGCGRRCIASDEMAGRAGRCVHCGAVLRVPAMAGAAGASEVYEVVGDGGAEPPPLPRRVVPIDVGYEGVVLRAHRPLPDGMIHFPGEAIVDLWGPIVGVLGLLTAAVLLAAVFARGAATNAAFWLVWTMQLVNVAALFAIIVPLALLGVYLGSRIMEFAMPPRTYLRLAGAYSIPITMVLLVEVLGGWRGGRGWLVIAGIGVWAVALWGLLRLRAANFATTFVFVAVFSGMGVLGMLGVNGVATAVALAMSRPAKPPAPAPVFVRPVPVPGPVNTVPSGVGRGPRVAPRPGQRQTEVALGIWLSVQYMGDGRERDAVEQRILQELRSQLRERGMTGDVQQPVLIDATVTVIGMGRRAQVLVNLRDAWNAPVGNRFRVITGSSGPGAGTGRRPGEMMSPAEQEELRSGVARAVAGAAVELLETNRQRMGR